MLYRQWCLLHRSFHEASFAMIALYLSSVLKFNFSIINCYESGSGFGELPAGFDLSSGSGINSLLSLGGKIILPCFQSSFACSIRSLREETKFHQIKRSPKGSPPKSIRVVFSLAMIAGSSPLLKTSIFPEVYTTRDTSI